MPPSLVTESKLRFEFGLVWSRESNSGSERLGMGLWTETLTSQKSEMETNLGSIMSSFNVLTGKDSASVSRDISNSIFLESSPGPRTTLVLILDLVFVKIDASAASKSCYHHRLWPMGINCVHVRSISYILKAIFSQNAPTSYCENSWDVEYSF